MELRIKKIFLICLVSLNTLLAGAQSFSGTTGLLYMPTADMQKDKTFMFGGNYLNTNHLSTHFHSKEVDYTFNYYLNITIFPWLEVGYTCTLVHADHGSTYFPEKVWGKFSNQDRAFYGRLRLWKEGWLKEWTPQIVIGLDDPASHESYGGGEIISGNTKGSNNYATRYYLAVTKHFNFNNIGALGIHTAFIWGKAKGIPEYKRPAIGANFRLKLLGEEFYKKVLNGLNLMAEYDGRTINIGSSYTLWKDYINLTCALNECKYFSGGIFFKVHLK
ncbi:MAG: YjbH domain-containing protein [Bacteroidaceae bacterium]|nr:YjbH domain-containing protein [Bacteroidaceae bacterium]